ncbi:sensor histidine kinase [Occultella gossypii]|uniref:Two-component sensor histidine kinase n=1 Tax=Occultella gossypii TaxID=2800820 RepID=A0ABS7S7K4_9MICO|nr:histidine kinase [Occultella gossypii]MBZ2196062.1 two-component sensor histidine kinase [Occultella gossypii]
MSEPTELGRGGHGLPRLAVLLGGTAWLLALAGLLLFLSSRPAGTVDDLFLIVDVMVGLVYGTVATVVLLRRSHVVGYLAALTAVGGGLSALGGGWRMFAESRGLTPGPLADTFGWAWVPGTLALFLVVPWLVRERPLGRAWWGPATGGLIAAAALVASLAGNYAVLAGVLVVAVVFGLTTAVAVEARRRRSPESEAVGLGWLGLGTLVLAVSFVPLLLPVGTVPDWLTPALHLASQALFPAAILTVVLRQRLWGMELAVSRALLAGVLTAALAGIYLLAALLAGVLIPGQGIAQAVAAAAVVIAVGPTRLWFAARIRRLVYGVAHDPWRVASSMGTRIGRGGTDDGLLTSLVESVGTALRLESVTVRGTDPAETSTGGDLNPEVAPVLAAWGLPTGGPVAVPLISGDRTIGTLEATPRPGETLDATTRRALDELAAVVTAGLVLIRTADELTRTRRRLTDARLQERRVIRRELHDGLGPWLAGLRLGLQGVANTIRTDPDGATKMLRALQGELDQRIEDVRTIARTLLPPVLEELGLEPALAELAARHRRSGFDVRLRFAVDADLPDPVAAACYGIAAEAVLNAARHSGAAECELEVCEVEAAVRVSCRDGGVGYREDARVGVGTLSMRERAEELGGAVEVRHLAPHGTAVEATIPVRPPGMALPDSQVGTGAGAGVNAAGTLGTAGST